MQHPMNQRAENPTRQERGGRNQATEVEEFAKAMDRYRRSSGRKFPTWCEVLEVLNGLGYAKPERPGDRNERPW